MNLLIETGEAEGVRFVIAKAVLYVNRKRHVRQWRLDTVAPKFTLEEQRHAIEEEAKRWEQTILNPVIQKSPVQEKLL